jgi:hypothetical protein
VLAVTRSIRFRKTANRSVLRVAEASGSSRRVPDSAAAFALISFANSTGVTAQGDVIELLTPAQAMPPSPSKSNGLRQESELELLPTDA